MRYYLLSLILLLLSACGTTGSEQQTLVAFDNDLQTDQAVMAATATANMEELLFTLDYSALLVERENQRQNDLISTMQAREISVQLPPTLTPSPPPTATLSPTPGAPADTATPAPATEIIVTPFLPSPTPQPNTPTPRPTRELTNLRNVVMALDVGEDDCATQRTNSFNPQTAEIYVVASAFNITPGTRISSQWRDDQGELLAEFDFTPDFAINGECIWFFADQTDFEFVEGSYTVELFVNDEGQNAAATFQIVGN